MKNCITFVFLMFASVCWGQTALMPVLSIDGGNNPELIPDATAYRLVLRNVNMHGTRLFSKLGLANPDAVVLANAASQLVTAIAVAGADKDAIATAAIGTLKTTLSAEGAAAFDKYVQSEKQNMKVYTLGAQ